MRSLNEQKEFDVPFSGPYLECPACGERLVVVATVDVEKGEVRQTGSNGFNRPNYSVDISAKIRKFTIQHQCVPTQINKE